MNEQYFISVVDLNKRKIFSLPTLYTDRTEACVCGQNFVRDHRTKNLGSLLFYRVLISKDGKVAPTLTF